MGGVGELSSTLTRSFELGQDELDGEGRGRTDVADDVRDELAEQQHRLLMSRLRRPCGEKLGDEVAGYGHAAGRGGQVDAGP